MQLVLEHPDFQYALHGADGRIAKVNDRLLRESFIVTPMTLVEGWNANDVTTMVPEQLQPILELEPELILIGCGDEQRFPPAEVQAACLAQGVGLEIMTNASAARTFNVLAAEGRKVVAGFLLAG